LACQQSLVAIKSLGEQGIYKTLYARYYKIIGPKTAKEARRLQIIEKLLPEAAQAFSALYTNN
jgi:hypothetical protein